LIALDPANDENDSEIGTMTHQEVQRIKRFSEEWWANYPQAENRCVAHRKNGNQCLKAARRGATVCRFHGGAAPQVKAKARERLELAADRMAKQLLGIATGAESETVKLAAVKDALDRAGLSAKQNVEVGVELKPYEQVLSDIAGVAHITRAESRARRGLPPDEREPLEIVEAELVPEPPASRPDRGGAAQEGDERPDLPDDDSAPRSRPPGRSLATLEDALGDTGIANRRARVLQVRRVRQR
jgi:hypothetical protein